MTELIISLLILSGVGGILALLLEIADFYLADYGEKNILINREKDLVVKGGQPLLFTLAQEDIFIPSACGGKGTCAYCKVKVLEGGGPILPTERPYLDPDEMEDHVRLSCQVKVKEDLKIEIPKEIFLVKQFRVRVRHIEELTPIIKSVRFRILSPEGGIMFNPGQYVQLEIPKYKKSSAAEFRAYSIASSDEIHDEITLIITKAQEGVVSTYVHEYMKEGDELAMSGPFGDFYLREADREILMIATGSGLAPMLSMLHQIEREQIRRKSTLFFGARRKKDLYYHEELREFENRIPQFTFLPTLSRVPDTDRWEGERGRVTDLINRYVPEGAPLDAYICGSPQMVESSITALEEKGIAQEHIFFDKFE